MKFLSNHSIDLFILAFSFAVVAAYDLPESVLTKQIDIIRDDRRLLIAERMLMFALDNLTKGTCNRCFSNNVHYKNFCLRLLSKQRVQFLNHYKC